MSGIGRLGGVDGGNKVDFIEKVVVEKEASCAGVCREGCPRQGEWPGQRLEPCLMALRSSEGLM